MRVELSGVYSGIAAGHVLLGGAGLPYPAVAEAGITALRFYPEELLVLAAAALIGLVAALIPAVAVYRGSLMPILDRS